MPLHCLECQAIFAVLSVTPTERLSEQVLADGILTYFQMQQKIPAGIAVSAVEALAAKLALGLRKVTGKFKRLHGQSPSSKTLALTRLKKRLSEHGLSPGDEADASPVDVQAVEIVAAASVSPSPPVTQPVPSVKQVDWKAMAAKFQQFKAAKPAAQQSQRPVPTPARSSHMLPEHVLETLKQSTCPVEPFSTTSDAVDDGGKVPGEDDDSELAKKKKTKPVKKTAAKTKAKKAQKKKEIAGPQEEEGLSLAAPPQQAAVFAAAPPAAQGQQAGEEPAGAYVAGKFSDIRKQYIKNCRAAKGVSHKEANREWMHSDERSSYLATLSMGELKKRRFV